MTSTKCMECVDLAKLLIRGSHGKSMMLLSIVLDHQKKTGHTIPLPIPRFEMSTVFIEESLAKLTQSFAKSEDDLSSIKNLKKIRFRPPFFEEDI